MDLSLRNLRIIGYSFIPVVLGGFIAVTALHQGWAEIDQDLARIGFWVTTLLGVVGVGASIWWRNRVTERPIEPAALTTSFFITAAVAEASLLAGFVFTVTSHGPRPFFIGVGAFAISLVVILTSFSQIEVHVDDSPAVLLR